MRMNLEYFESFHVAIDSETSIRVRHCAIRNEWDFSSRKKWKNEFQILESTSPDSSLSVIIVKRRTLRATEREREFFKLGNHMMAELRIYPTPQVRYRSK